MVRAAGSQSWVKTKQHLGPLTYFGHRRAAGMGTRGGGTAPPPVWGCLGAQHRRGGARASNEGSVGVNCTGLPIGCMGGWPLLPQPTSGSRSN